MKKKKNNYKILDTIIRNPIPEESAILVCKQ